MIPGRRAVTPRARRAARAAVRAALVTALGTALGGAGAGCATLVVTPVPAAPRVTAAAPVPAGAPGPAVPGGAVGPRARPIATLRAEVTSAYVLFLPVPGEVDAARVVEGMLLPAARALGADRLVDVRVRVTSDRGLGRLRRVLGWRRAEARALAVVDDDADAAEPPDASAARPAPPR